MKIYSYNIVGFYPKINKKEVFIITLSDLFNKLKSLFIKSNKPSDNVESLNSNNIDNLQVQILANKTVESPTVSFQLLFKVYKKTLNSSIDNAKTLRLNINSAYLDDYNLEISKEKEFVNINNPCGEKLPQITGYYYWEKKYVSTGVYFNVALLNDVDFTSDNPTIEVYDFTQSNFTVLPFEYCSTEIPYPKKEDFLVNIKSATTLLNPIESEDEVDYYLYTADLEGKIYLAPLIQITGDSYTLSQLNNILAKDSSNTMFSRGELASINSLEYKDIVNLSLNLDNFKYFTNLESLRIENCNYNTIPNEICNLPKLKELALPFNEITTIPDSLSNLYNLEILYLDNNKISTLPTTLGNLNNLQEIHVEYNSISNLSIFKNKNIYVYADNQFIYKGNLSLVPGHHYEFNIEFLRDFNDQVPTITGVNLYHNTSPLPFIEDMINNEHYIILDYGYIGKRVYIIFNSSSSLSTFSGEVSLSLI